MATHEVTAMPEDVQTVTLTPRRHDATPQPSLKKLSVLMPVYNERWTLAEIVSRVLASPTSLEIELVIVDDGSSDGSWELIRRLAEEDARIKAVNHPCNRGKGAAVRTAIEHMTGDVAVIKTPIWNTTRPNIRNCWRRFSPATPMPCSVPDSSVIRVGCSSSGIAWQIGR